MLMHSPQFNPDVVFEVMVPDDVLGLYKLITMRYHMSEMSTLDYVKILCNNMGRWTVNLRRIGTVKCQRTFYGIVLNQGPAMLN